MPWIPAAIMAGSAIMGAVGGSKAAKKKAKAAKKAQKFFLGETQKGLDVLGEYYGKATAPLQPYIGLGERYMEDILPMYEYLITGKGKPFHLRQSPLYQWQKDIAQSAVNRQLSARGLYNSGQAIRQQNRLQLGLMAEETERQLQRLGGLAQYGLGLGLQGAGMQISPAITTGGNLANLYLARGTGGAELKMLRGAAQAEGTQSMFGGLGSAMGVMGQGFGMGR